MKIRIVTLAAFAALLPLTLVHAADGDQKPKKSPFARLDANGDGVVTKEEFMASPQGTKNPDAAAKRFAHLDKNGDGNVSADEFKAGAPQGEGKKGEKGEKGEKPEKKAKKEKGA